MFIVGIDVAKRKHDVSVITTEGDVVFKPFSIMNRCSGYNYLMEKLHKLTNIRGEFIFAMESTAHYWLALYTRLKKDGYTVVVLNPVQTSSMREMCLQHEAHHAACTLLTAENPELTMWARIVRGPDGRFRQIIEGKDCTPEQAQIKELFAGVLVFDSREMFRLLPQLHNANVQQEYYLTEIPEMMAREGLLVETFPTDDASDLRGINTPEDVEICRDILRQRQQR